MAVKVTFTLDEETVAKLAATAQRLARPKSAVVRDAIRDFHARSDRLSDAERERMLRVLDEYATRAPKRKAATAAKEWAEIRAARRSGGRLHPVD